MSAPIAAPAGHDPLAALKPILLPPPPSFWPPAPGWWLLLLLLLGLSAALWIGLRRRASRRAPWLQALQLAEQINPQHSPQEQLLALNQLLRRAARARHGTVAATLRPVDWADFLRSSAPAELHDADWTGFAQAPYLPCPPERHGELLALGKAWLRHHLPC